MLDGKNIVGILYPNFLKEEIEAHLENWIDSVITSFSMVENIDYKINMIKQKYKKIIPVDFSILEFLIIIWYRTMLYIKFYKL